MTNLLTLVLMGGTEYVHTNFVCETIEKVIRLCTVLIFLSDSFKDMGNFRDFNLVLMAGDRICPLQIDR